MYLVNPHVALGLVAIWPWLPLLPCFLWEGMSSYIIIIILMNRWGEMTQEVMELFFSASSGRLGFPVPPEQLSLAPATFFPA